MPTDSHQIPRLKEFKYRVEFNGLPAFLIQEFDAGERAIGVTKHAGGGQNFASKEGGFMEYHDAVLKMVIPVSGIGKFYFDKWMDQVQDPATGNGLPAPAYRQTFSVYEMDNDGKDVRITEFYRAWPSHIKPGNRHSMQQDKDVIEEVHITYEYRKGRDL